MVTSLNAVSEALPTASDQTDLQTTLGDALQNMEGDLPCDIPWIVRLLENPDSPVALPGKIDLFGHDCLHLLLDKGLSLDDEAFVVGFTMGNDIKTNWLHLVIFKICSSTVYPKPYRFKRMHLKSFDLGVTFGRSIQYKNLNQLNFGRYKNQSLKSLRRQLGL